MYPQTLSRHFCAVPAHRFASCPSSWPTVLRAQLRSWPTIARPITRQAHSCPAQLHSWPQTLPNSPPNDGKPSPTSAKPPEAVSKFHQPRQHSEVYEPLRKSPTFSTPSLPPPGLRQAPSVPLLLSKPLASPARFAAAPECPPTRIAAISAFSCRLQPKPSHISHAGEL